MAQHTHPLRFNLLVSALALTIRLPYLITSGIQESVCTQSSVSHNASFETFLASLSQAVGRFHWLVWVDLGPFGSIWVDLGRFG